MREPWEVEESSLPPFALLSLFCMHKRAPILQCVTIIRSGAIHRNSTRMAPS